MIYARSNGSLRAQLAGVGKERDDLRQENDSLRADMADVLNGATHTLTSPLILSAPIAQLPTLLAEGNARNARPYRRSSAPPAEISFADCTGRMFRDALTDVGFITLRNAIPLEKLHHFRDAFVLPAIDLYARMTREEIVSRCREGAQWWGDDSSLEMWIGSCATGTISDPMLSQATGSVASHFDLVSNPSFHALLAMALPGTPFLASPVAHCRRISPASQPSGSGWAGAVPLHCDLRYHRDAKFAVNFWTPLTPAGPAHDSPTLETAAISLADVAGHLEYGPGTDHLFTPRALIANR